MTQATKQDAKRLLTKTKNKEMIVKEENKSATDYEPIEKGRHDAICVTVAGNRRAGNCLWCKKPSCYNMGNSLYC